MKKEDYHRRSLSETVNSMMKGKYDDTLHSKGFWNQRREILMMAVVHNMERKISCFLVVVQLRIATALIF